MLDGVLAAGRGAAGVWGPLAPVRRAALDRIFTQGASLRLQFVKEDLGFVYKGANRWVIDEERRVIDEEKHTEDEEKHMAVGTQGDSWVVGERSAQFTPVVMPGARLPHVAVRVLQQGWSSAGGCKVGEKECSLHDLVQYATADGRPAWTAVVYGVDGGAMATKVRAAANTLHVVLLVAAVEEYTTGTDDQISVVVDKNRAWAGLRGGHPSPIVLVRPDGHIAWQGHDINAASRLFTM